MTEEQLNTELEKLEADLEVPFEVPIENPPEEKGDEKDTEPKPPIKYLMPSPVVGIYRALVAIMREIGPVARDSMNKEQNYKYRSAESVLNRCQPLFAQHGVFMTPKVLKSERHKGETKRGGVIWWSVLTVEYTFFHEDGSSISCYVMGEGMDTGDKATAKAMTIAQKAAICQILNLPYAAVDPEAHTPEWAAKANGRVTMDQLTKLKKAWLVTQKELDTSDTDAVKTAFSDWVKKHAKGEFDPLDFKQWTTEAHEACVGALKT